LDFWNCLKENIHWQNALEKAQKVDLDGLLETASIGTSLIQNRDLEEKENQKKKN